MRLCVYYNTYLLMYLCSFMKSILLLKWKEKTSTTSSKHSTISQSQYTIQVILLSYSRKFGTNFAGRKKGLSYNTRRWCLKFWNSNQMSLCEDFYSIGKWNKNIIIYMRTTQYKVVNESKEFSFPRSIFSFWIAKY